MEFAKRVKRFVPKEVSIKDLKKIAPLVKTRIKKLSEFENFALPLFNDPGVPSKKLIKKIDILHLKKAYESLEKLNIKDWNDKLDKTLMKVIEENEFKTGKFFMSLRIAIFSNNVTPPINDSMRFLGKKETLSRIKKLIK
jgi:glutamyl/glutaminyl-tRNA synthetase